MMRFKNMFKVAWGKTLKVYIHMNREYWVPYRQCTLASKIGIII